MSDDDFKDFLDHHSEKLRSNYDLTDEVLQLLKSTGILTQSEYDKLVAVPEKDKSQRAIKFHDLLYDNPHRSRSNIRSIISVFQRHEKQGVVTVLRQWLTPGEEVPEAVEPTSVSSKFPNCDLTIPVLMADRRKELAVIDEVLQNLAPSGARVAILAGMGGAGKTTLARLYLITNKNSFEKLYWIDAEHKEEVQRAFKQIQDPSIGGLEDKGFSIKERDSERVHKTLLIFDNVELLPMMHKYLPKTVSKAKQPTIIITTRACEDWEDLQKHVVPIRELSMDVCETYIRQSLAKSPWEIPDLQSNWERLAEQFGGLVIALQAAVNSIVAQNKLHEKASKQVYTIANFLEDVSKFNILEEDADQRNPVEKVYRPLRQLWTKTLNELPHRDYGETSEKILYVLAFFGPEGVRKKWFFQMFKKDCDAQVMHGIDELTAWSLADSTKDNLVMHRLLQSIVVSRVHLDSAKSSMFFKWLEGALRRLFKHLHANDMRNDQRDLKFCLRALCEQLSKYDNVCEVAVKFCANMVRFPSVPFLEFRKVRVIFSKTQSLFDLLEFVGCFLDQLCEKIEAGEARVSPQTLGLVAKTARFEGHRLIPIWLKVCSSLPWSEKVSFVTSVLTSRSHKNKTRELSSRYFMNSKELEDRVQLSVSISELLFEPRADLLGIESLHGIQSLNDFLWWEHLWYLEELVTQQSEDLPAKTVEIQRSMIQIFKNVNNTVAELTRRIFESDCQDCNKLLSYIDILIKWQNFFTCESVQPLLVLKEEVRNLKKGGFSDLEFPAGRYKPLEQTLTQLYAFFASASEEQKEFEIRILVLFSRSLDSFNGLDVNRFTIFSKLISFVYNTNKFCENRALCCLMMLLSFEKILKQVSDGASLQSSFSCDGDALVLLKIQTLPELISELCSNDESPTFNNRPQLQEALCALQLLVPIPDIAGTNLCIGAGSHQNFPNFTKRDCELLYRLELAISKNGYQGFRVYKLLAGLLTYNKTLIENINTILLLVEQITWAAERESNSKKNAFDEEDHLCSCYHVLYQMMLAESYQKAGEYEKAAEKVVQVCQHRVECGVKQMYERHLADSFAAIQKSIAKVEHQETQQKYQENPALLQSQVALAERERKKSKVCRWDTVRLYCIQGKLSKATKRLDRLLGRGQINDNQSFDLLAIWSLTLSFQLLFRKDYQAAQRLSDQIYNESLKYPSFTQNYQYLLKTVRALAKWKAEGTAFPLTELEEESEPAVGEFDDFFDTSIKWCIRVRKILRFKDQNASSEIPSVFEWMSELAQTMYEPSAYLLYFRALEDILELQNKSSGRKLGRFGYLEDLKKTINLNYFDPDGSDWEFSVLCLIRDYGRGDLNKQ